jgi:hypothetical protein
VCDECDEYDDEGRETWFNKIVSAAFVIIIDEINILLDRRSGRYTNSSSCVGSVFENAAKINNDEHGRGILAATAAGDDWRRQCGGR